MERNGLFEVMKRAKLLILPSLYHESGPLTLLEAFACGTPVLASDLPSLDEFVTDKVNGLRFRVGDAAHLAERIQWLLSRPELMPALRKAARLSYEQKYTAERNYGLLMDIYLKATRSAPAAA
jgi:glycosyltransferase involved in cell wall biosynthesis